MLGFMLVIEFNDGTLNRSRSVDDPGQRPYLRPRQRHPMRTLDFTMSILSSYSLQPYTASPTRLNATDHRGQDGMNNLLGNRRSPPIWASVKSRTAGVRHAPPAHRAGRRPCGGRHRLHLEWNAFGNYGKMKVCHEHG